MRTSRLLARIAPARAAGLLFFCLAGHISAQDATPPQRLSGRVLHRGEGVAGVELELHRVTPAASGVIGTARSNASGRFEFRLPPVDTVGFTVFFVTADHESVRYFGPPLHSNEARDGYTVEVFDTTSTPERPVRVGRRDMVLIPQPDGSWEINEVVRFLNAGDRTVVSASGMPTAELSIPRQAAAFEAGDGEMPADQIRRMGERVLLLMPILPGEREIFFRYRLPARPEAAEFAMRSPADSLNLFVRQPAPRLEVVGLSPSDVVQVEGERFLQYSAAGEVPMLRIAWPGAGGLPVSPVTAAVALSMVVLLAGGVAALRGRTH